mgnify:FL=1
MYLGKDLTKDPAKVFSLAEAKETASMMQDNEEDDWTWKATPVGNGKAIVECFEPDGYKIGLLANW